MAEAVAALIEAQEDAENGELGFLPWFLFRIYPQTLQTGEQRLLLPGGFIREYEHERYALWLENIGPATRVPFLASDGRGSYRDGRVSYYIDEASPVSETETCRAIMFNREFDCPIRTEFLYYAQDTRLHENIENSWLRYGSKYLIGSAGIKLAGVRDRISREQFERMQREGTGNLLRQDTSYRTGASKYQFGQTEERNIPSTGRRFYSSYGNLRYNDTDTGN